MKNLTVRLGPIVKVRPLKKRMLPIIRKPLSKKVMMPSDVNSSPKLVRPMPISATRGGKIEQLNIVRWEHGRVARVATNRAMVR